MTQPSICMLVVAEQSWTNGLAVTFLMPPPPWSTDPKECHVTTPLSPFTPEHPVPGSTLNTKLKRSKTYLTSKQPAGGSDNASDCQPSVRYSANYIDSDQSLEITSSHTAASTQLRISDSSSKIHPPHKLRTGIEAFQPTDLDP